MTKPGAAAAAEDRTAEANATKAFIGTSLSLLVSETLLVELAFAPNKLNHKGREIGRGFMSEAKVLQPEKQESSSMT
jgi:hypothetical protein